MSSNTKSGMKYVHMIVIFMLLFGFQYLPAPGQVTELGMRCFGILVGAIYGWIFVDLFWPSMAALIALGLSGYYDNMTVALGSAFGNQTVVLIMALLFVTAYIQQSNCSELIIGWLLNLKIAKKNVWFMFYIFFVACFAVALVAQSVPAAILFLAIYRDMAHKIKIPKENKINSFVLCGIILSATISEVAAPFKLACLFGISVFAQMTGMTINWLIYCLVFIPLVLVVIALFCLISKFILRIDVSIFTDITELIHFNVVANKQQKTALICIFMFLVVLLLQSCLPAEWAITVFLNRLGLGGIGLLFLIVMCLIRVEGEQLLKVQELTRSFQWGMYMMMAFFLPFASALVDDRTGVKATVMELVGPIAETLPGYAIVVALILVTVLCTNFLNNGVIGMVAVTTLAALYGTVNGINFMAAAIIIFVAANGTALVTPAASPVCAVVYSQSDLVNKIDLAKIGFVTALFMTAFVLTVVYGIYAVVI